ncbi:hypothetical protein GWK08_04250 [Leptobacterium flavescens]|uniref:Uncharacterized protein n=1 Tax=Leptobacterium flavescens TaxID=472055 RepID=A0A6P0UJR3_9FLAO|nr:hypothetical protein [Leptobacterium flavescens]NER12640.1 hypothetical protein [Leptobacterium flavescens]
MIIKISADPISLMIVFLTLIFVDVLICRKHRKEIRKRNEAITKYNRIDLVTIRELIHENSDTISGLIKKINALYSSVAENIGLQDASQLKKNRKDLKKLEEEVHELKTEIYYFVRSLDGTSAETIKFYISVLDYIHHMVQSIGYIVKNSYVHVKSKQRNLRFNQIRDLRKIDDQLQILFSEIEKSLGGGSLEGIHSIIEEKTTLLEQISGLIGKQIDQSRSAQSNPKNNRLYFKLLLQTKDLITATMNLLCLLDEFHHSYKTVKTG